MRIPIFWLAIIGISSVISCKPNAGNNPLEGIWLRSYIISKQKEVEPYSETVLYEFIKGKMITTHIGGTFNGYPLDTFISDSVDYTFKQNELDFGEGSIAVNVSNDSIVMDLGDIKSVLKKIPDAFKMVKVDKNCWVGSYKVENEIFKESLEIINDKYFLITSNSSAKPVYQWGLIEYKGLKFFTTNSLFRPATIISSCLDKGFDLIHPVTFQPIHHTLNPKYVNKEKLYGNWIEVKRAKTPKDTNFYPTEGIKYQLNIDKDGWKEKLFGPWDLYKWNLTKDGKLIYFLDSSNRITHVYKPKIQSDSTLILQRDPLHISNNTILFEKSLH